MNIKIKIAHVSRWCLTLQTEREAYEVVVEDGKFAYKQSGKVLDTRGGPKEAKWIFVLSTSKTLYVGMKSKGTFQHSSFLAGGATLSAGRLVVEDGVLKVVINRKKSTKRSQKFSIDIIFIF